MLKKRLKNICELHVNLVKKYEVKVRIYKIRIAACKNNLIYFIDINRVTSISFFFRIREIYDVI